MILLSLISAMILSLPAQAAADTELCQSLVVQRVAEDETEAPSLSELKEELAGDGGATILFRIDLESIRPSLDTLNKVTQANDDVGVPVRVFGEGSLLIIAQGPRDSLLKFAKTLADNGFEEQTTFYRLSPRPTKPLAAPRSILHSEDELEQARAGGESFAAFISNQIVFFLPRSVVDGLDGSRLSKEKINVTYIRRTPTSWTDWLSTRADELKGKTIILAGDWAIVSSAAFAQLQKMPDPNGGEDVSPALAALNRKILDVLEAPASRRAARTAATDNSDTSDRLTKPVRKIIIKYLSDHRGRTKLNEASGLERAFMALAKFLPNERATESYRKALREIGFNAWDYTSLGRESDASIERFVHAWRTFLKAAKNPYADLPLNARNTREAINHLPE